MGRWRVSISLTSTTRLTSATTRRCRALADKGLFDEAIAEYEKVLKMDPNNPVVLESIKKAKEALNAGSN